MDYRKQKDAQWREEAAPAADAQLQPRERKMLIEILQQYAKEEEEDTKMMALEIQKNPQCAIQYGYQQSITN